MTALTSCTTHSAQGYNALSHNGPFIQSVDRLKAPQQIPITVDYPQDKSSPYPLVIDMHGCSGIIPVRQKDWVQRLNQWGYAVIKPDSFTARGARNICDDVFKVSPLHRLNDLSAAIAYALNDKKIDAQNIFVMGMSHGGTTVLLTHYRYHKYFEHIKGVIAYYPYCIELLPHLIADTLILIGAKDDWTPAAYCQNMVVADKKDHHFELVVYPNAFHSFDVRGAGGVFHGHRLGYDYQYANDSFVRVKSFLAARTKSE